MARGRLAGFLARYVIVGVAVALGVVWLAPELLDSQRPVVEVQQASPAQGSAPARGPVSSADAVRRAAPAVVNIYTAKTSSEPRHPFFDDPLFERFFGNERRPRQPRTETSLGSGVLMSSKGYVLTNNHVIRNASAIQVLLADGRRASATVVGTDPETDLAVLRVPLDDLPAITSADSEAVSVGDVVLAIGNPFGVGQTVTQGIVSATGRSELGLTTFEDFIQTDAAINPGNSGGALINAEGELVGINTAIYSRSGGSMGIGFAIPANLAQGVMASIIENGRVIRGWIGVQIQAVTPELADSFGLDAARGVVVAGVYQGGPADRAGLRPGDVILKVGGEPVAGPRELLRRVTRREPGTTVTLSGRREGSTFQRELTVSARPTNGTAREDR